MPQINPDSGNQVNYDHVPDVCPQCHHALNPKILQATLNGNASARGTLLEIAFKCTYRNCRSMFIGSSQPKASFLDAEPGLRPPPAIHAKPDQLIQCLIQTKPDQLISKA